MARRKTKYAKYLRSSAWHTLRSKVKLRCKGRCERCHFNLMDHVHHLTYERIFRENLSDLLGVCKGCHNFIHGKSTFDPLKSLL